MKIKELFSQNKKQFFLYIFGTLIITPSNIMVTFALAKAFDIFTVNTSQEVIRVVTISLVLGLLPILLQVISRYLRIGFMRDVLVQVRLMSYKKLLNKSSNEFSSESREKYQSQLVSDINLFENDFFLAILNIVYSFGNFILGITVLLYISPLIAFTTVLASIVLFVVTKIFEKPTIKRKERVLLENGYFHASLTNILRGLETIKLYQVVEKFKSLFYRDINELERFKKDSFQMTLLQENITQWISGSYQVFGLIYAAYLFSLNKIELSALVIVFNLIGQIIWGMNSGFSMINRYKTSKKIFNTIAVYKEKPQLDSKFKLNNQIQINNLSYQYNNKKVLSDVNLTINKNDKVLIFGPSGTGKTTLVNTMTKNLDDFKGEVLYDGVSLKEIDNQSFINKVGYVRQEHFIFDDTIKNNIILDKGYDQDKFINILKQSHLETWIKNLELKENHILLDNGSNISGGQRQRINLARELYQDKEVIIFDEPSSSLDDATSKWIYNSIKSLDKTVIVISHRHLDYLKDNFDQVIDLSMTGGVNHD